MMIGVVVFSLLSKDAGIIQIGYIGIHTPAIAVLYVIAVRTTYIQESRNRGERLATNLHATMSLEQVACRNVLTAAVVATAGIVWLFIAVELATTMGWGQSFVGTLLVALATSVPEAAATVGAVRLRAIDLAIGNLFGSNLFNILVLAVDDIFYLDGPLLQNVSPMHALSGVSAMIMTGAVVICLHYPSVTRVFRLMGWASLALVITYILNSLVLYLHDH